MDLKGKNEIALLGVYNDVNDAIKIILNLNS
jgi:hypothetical protein